MSAKQRKTDPLPTSAQFAREASPAYQEAQEAKMILEWNSRRAAKREALVVVSAKMVDTTKHIVDAETFLRWKNGPWRRSMAAYRVLEPIRPRSDRYGNMERI